MPRSTFAVVSAFCEHAKRNDIAAMLPLLSGDLAMHEARRRTRPRQGLSCRGRRMRTSTLAWEASAAKP